MPMRRAIAVKEVGMCDVIWCMHLTNDIITVYQLIA